MLRLASEIRPSTSQMMFGMHEVHMRIVVLTGRWRKSSRPMIQIRHRSRTACECAAIHYRHCVLVSECDDPSAETKWQTSSFGRAGDMGVRHEKTRF